MLGALVGLAAGGALVFAHGGNPARMHACMDDKGRLHIVGPNDCQDVTKAVDWNIASGEGEPGSHGPQGATGAPGPAGPAGRDGTASDLPIRMVVTASAWGAPGARTVEARCNANEFAISGGWRAEDPSGVGEFTASESRPLDEGRGWRARVTGWYAHKGWRLVVHAACTPRRSAG
jgi:hypothetical protein